MNELAETLRRVVYDIVVRPGDPAFDEMSETQLAEALAEQDDGDIIIEINGRMALSIAVQLDRLFVTSGRVAALEEATDGLRGSLLAAVTEIDTLQAMIGPRPVTSDDDLGDDDEVEIGVEDVLDIHDLPVRVPVVGGAGWSNVVPVEPSDE